MGTLARGLLLAEAWTRAGTLACGLLLAEAWTRVGTLACGLLLAEVWFALEAPEEPEAALSLVPAVEPSSAVAAPAPTSIAADTPAVKTPAPTHDAVR